MAAVPSWTFYAYFNGDADGERDERREIADWQVDDVVRWARHRGFDTIHLTRGEETADFHNLDIQGVDQIGLPRSRVDAIPRGGESSAHGKAGRGSGENDAGERPGQGAHFDRRGARFRG